MNIIELKQTCKEKKCQGDVNLYLLSKEVPFDGDEYIDPVLVYGDTGNHHKLNTKEFTGVKTKDGPLLIKLIKPTKLTHQQHGAINLKAGIYLIDRSKEKGMFDDMVSPVVD